MTTARSGRLSRGGLLKAAAFLLPAALFLGAMLVYPIIFTAIRSTFDASGQNFVGLGNYVKIFSEPRTLVAIRNNLIWVLVVPIAVTGIGLILAVLSNNLRFRSAFRLFLFLPLVVSGLAAGVTFRFLYAADPDVGAVNALVRGVAHIFQPPGDYPTARPAATAPLEALDGGFLSTEPVASGSTLNLGLVGIMPGRLPEGSERALAAEPAAGTVQGTVWLDASAGGTPGVIDEAELGLRFTLSQPITALSPPLKPSGPSANRRSRAFSCRSLIRLRKRSRRWVFAIRKRMRARVRSCAARTIAANHSSQWSILLDWLARCNCA